jgi:hypothetical protein
MDDWSPTGERLILTASYTSITVIIVISLTVLFKRASRDPYIGRAQDFPTPDSQSETPDKALESRVYE